MSIRFNPRSRAIVALTLIAFAAAACGSGGSGAPAVSTGAGPSGASNAGATTAPASTTATAGGGTSSDIDACSLLTVAQASTIVGRTYVLATPQSIATGQDVCRYDTATDGEGMTVTVYQPSSGVTFEMMDSVLRTVGTTTSVSGVGDKAEKNSIELVAHVGDRLIDVNGAGSTSGDSTSKDAAIANAVIAALP